MYVVPAWFMSTKTKTVVNFACHLLQHYYLHCKLELRLHLVSLYVPSFLDKIQFVKLCHQEYLYH